MHTKKEVAHTHTHAQKNTIFDGLCVALVLYTAQNLINKVKHLTHQKYFLQILTIIQSLSTNSGLKQLLSASTALIVTQFEGLVLNF